MKRKTTDKVCLMIRLVRNRGLFLQSATHNRGWWLVSGGDEHDPIATRRSSGTHAHEGTSSSCKVTDIVYDSKQNIVRVTFDSGEQYSYSSEYLRTQSPTATKESYVVAGRKYVRIMDILPVGRYGVQFCFDDLHNTGLFTYDYLLHLGRHKYSVMKQYLKKLHSKNASRDPRSMRR